MKKHDTIRKLYEAVKCGEVDEANLTVVLDNDHTMFFEGPARDEAGNDLDNEIEVAEANGYYDVEKLYALLFPKATVEWV